MYRFALIGAAALALAGCPLQKEYTVTVENLTDAQPMSPVALLTHSDADLLFTVGTPVSQAVELLAEGGDNSAVLKYGKQRNVEEALSGKALLPPGASDEFSLYVTNPHTRYLSMTSMLVNTNDALVAETDINISALRPGQSITLLVPAWDAGTEGNSESQATVPGPAAQGEGYNPERDDVNRIRIHPGVLSADDGLTGSALHYRHRFDNPAAKITIKRKW
ncbi:spondin domain-containing protein [Enterovibrio paralichthyis]|uniref:spondin domain-containing protein n=1 Tax=Enterovibrio paralichthyis TaxID=2853805 RepID=UPI001C473156|nr:spondin domain-containing protein [Enterovibrio paralichthyis]MBV7299019.1 spondin domain-containing protein [Enterovibrio paralichthyis]